MCRCTNGIGFWGWVETGYTRAKCRERRVDGGMIMDYDVYKIIIYILYRAGVVLCISR